MLGQQVPLLLQDLEEAHPRVLEAALGGPGIDPSIDLDEVFNLFRRAVDLVALHDRAVPE